MKVKELIVQLLNEDMDADVTITTALRPLIEAGEAMRDSIKAELRGMIIGDANVVDCLCVLDKASAAWDAATGRQGGKP